MYSFIHLDKLPENMPRRSIHPSIKHLTWSLSQLSVFCPVFERKAVSLAYSDEKERFKTYTMFRSHLLALVTGDLPQMDQVHFVGHQHHGEGLPEGTATHTHQSEVFDPNSL